jgi:hypothetical protein
VREPGGEGGKFFGKVQLPKLRRGFIVVVLCRIITKGEVE